MDSIFSWDFFGPASSLPNVWQRIEAKRQLIDLNHYGAKQRWWVMGLPKCLSTAFISELHTVSHREPQLQPFDFQDGALGFGAIFPPLLVAAVTYRFAERHRD